VTSAQAATHFISPWRNTTRHANLQSIIETLWSKTTCQLIECGRCTGVFAFPFIGGNSAFYAAAYAEQNTGAYPHDRWEYGESLRLCDHPGESLLKASSCLEIGAGDGAFLKRLIGAGVPQNAITALEYSNYGKTVISARYPGIDVRSGDDLNILPDGAFSHVFMFQVMEHLSDVSSFMSQLRRLLKPNGLAFISVPNPRRIEFNELNGLVLDMPPNHVSRFSDGAVKTLSSRNGFSLQKLVDQDFSWSEMVPQYLRYRYMRLAQNSGSIPARIDKSLSGRSRKVAAAFFALQFVPEALLRLRTAGMFGNSRLIVLQKCES
jgi:SAM-dependent methyltransferase